MKRSRIERMPYFADPILYDIYDKEIEKRIEKMLNGGLDDYAAVLYETGEIDKETFYRFVEEEACKEIYEELSDGRCENDF